MKTDRMSSLQHLHATGTRRSFARLLATGLAACLVLSASGRAQVTVEWVQPTRGVSVAVDAANNVFTLDYEQALGAEMTVTKRDVNGNLLWVASHDQTNATQWERASWITTDSAGNAIACGTLMSGYSNPVTFASIVMKVAPDGTVLWRNVIQNGADGGTRKCLVDASDNIYVLGLGSGPPGYVTRVNRFTPAGAAAWTYFDADGIGGPVNFKLTPDNDLVIAGRSFFGSVNGYARIDLDGRKVWSFAGVPSVTVGDVAGDALGNSYLVHAENVFNGGTLTRKLDSSGQVAWSRVYAFSGQRIEVGTDGFPVVAGFPSAGAGAAFIKYDAAGNLLWSNQDADGPGVSLLLHALLVVDESNDAYLAAGTLFAMAVCKVNSNGTSAWTQTTQGGSSASGMALGQHDDSVFVVGGSTTRWTDAAEGPWQNLGHGLAGAAGIPLLIGEGDLVAGNPVSLSVADAAPLSPLTLVLGGAQINLPLFGGVLVPVPAVLLTGFVTDGDGKWQLAAPTPAGLPPGVGIYLQAWCVDAGGPVGHAATNGVRATTP